MFFSDNFVRLLYPFFQYDKAYSLLVKVLMDTKKVAVGKVVLRDKEHLVVIRPYQRELVMHILHYLDEIRPADEISEFKGAEGEPRQ